VIFTVIAAILQSTLLRKIAVYKAVPDLALCILVYSSYVNGTMTGQVSGFLSGLLLDFLSEAPLGLNCLIRTLIGAFTGLFKDSLFLDTVFLPMILCALATIAKASLYFILHLIFGSVVPAYSVFVPLFWVELGLNSLMAPLLFFLLARFKFLSAGRN
jgi:rod shape-determining protein MreD